MLIKAHAITLVLLISLFVSNQANSKIKLDGWLELKSEHFTLYTDVDAEEAKKLILDLELLHVVVLKITNAPQQKFTVPTHVFLFKRTGDFRSLNPSRRWAGFFRPGMEVNYAALANKSGHLDSNAVIYHEYVHQLLRNGSSNYPKWYDEGLAEFFAAVNVDDGNVILGGESIRLRSLQNTIAKVSLDKTVNHDDTWGQNSTLDSYMYAISWATLNYMYTGFMAGLPRYGDKIPEYLSRLNQNEDRTKSFELAFGISTLQMEKDVYDYFQLKRRGVLRIPLDRFPHNTAVSITAMTPDKIRLPLIKLLNPGNPKAAQQLLAPVLEADGENWQYQIELIRSWQYQGEWDKALKAASSTLSEQAPLTYRQYGNLLLDYCYQRQTTIPCDKEFSQAEILFNKALAQHPDDVVTRAGLSKTLSMMNQNLLDAKEHSLAALERLPYHPMNNYWHGHILFQLEDYQAALPYLEKAEKWAHQDLVRSYARKDIELIQKRIAKPK